MSKKIIYKGKKKSILLVQFLIHAHRVVKQKIGLKNEIFHSDENLQIGTVVISHNISATLQQLQLQFIKNLTLHN